MNESLIGNGGAETAAITNVATIMDSLVPFWNSVIIIFERINKAPSGGGKYTMGLKTALPAAKG